MTHRTDGVGRQDRLRDMAFEEQMNQYRQMVDFSLAMGGPKKLAARKAEGHLNARERLALLLDEGSFRELGQHARAIRPELREKSAADGKISGAGTVDGRPVAVVSNDFTVVGASSSVINGKKMRHIREIADRRGMPIVFLGESTGARMPDRMGAAGRAILGQDPFEFRRTRRTPWVSALLGSCYGSSTWYGCMSDFVVMRKGATMAVASSKVTSLAINQPIDPEDLGGWRLHTETTGLVDVAVDTDGEALSLIKTFLSYLPSDSASVAPTAPVPEGSGADAGKVFDIFPEGRTTTYDVKKILELFVDKGSLFELKPRFGKSVVTALSRFNGRSVGIVASNPKSKGGAIDVDACRKVTSFIVLCDSFNIPLVFMVDQPGFLIGIDGERQGAPSKIMNWMNALSQCTVSKISITTRKNYGQAYLNMGGGRTSSAQACWPTADLGFMDPKVGVNVLFGVKEADDPERFSALVEEISQDSSAWSLAALYEAHSVIDPRETRNYVIETLDMLEGTPSAMIGEHLLSNWPTSY
jgi:acetyl-CoA carboxylase carboxyltransferase component